MATINRKVRDFSDINLLFTSHPATADVTKVTNENAVKAAVRNLILTKNYERPFHPEIGCQITSLLFENFNPITVNTMKRTIQDVIEKFKPRVRITQIVIIDKSDVNSIDVTVQFAVNNTERPITVTTTLTRAR